jgi:hypothetical protein
MYAELCVRIYRWRLGVDDGSAKWRREVTSFPPPDRSGASPPVGRSQFPLALSQGQSPDSLPGHPCSRECLLKDCERWFLPHHFQDRYCSAECRVAARVWRRWHAAMRYRVTANGKQRRREQAQRHRDRQRLRSAVLEPLLTPEVKPAASTIDQDVPPLADPPTAVNSSRVGQRPAEIPENSCLWPCGRPGCYVLFPLSPRFPRQHFCSCSCRRALRRIWQRESRLRRRRRNGRRRRRPCHHAPP